MINPLHKRIEEHRTRDDLLKLSLDRFQNFTKEIDKIKSRKNWIHEDKIKEIHNFINDEKDKIETLYKK